MPANYFVRDGSEQRLWGDWCWGPLEWTSGCVFPQHHHMWAETALCKESSGLVFHYIVRAHGNHWDSDLIRFSIFFPNFHSLEDLSLVCPASNRSTTFSLKFTVTVWLFQKSFVCLCAQPESAAVPTRSLTVGSEPQKMQRCIYSSAVIQMDQASEGLVVVVITPGFIHQQLPTSESWHVGS